MPACTKCGEETFDDEAPLCLGCEARYQRRCWHCRNMFFGPYGERTCGDCMVVLDCRTCRRFGELTAFDGPVCARCKSLMSTTCEHCLCEYYEGDADGVCPTCGYSLRTGLLTCRLCLQPRGGDAKENCCAVCWAAVDDQRLAQVHRDTLMAFPPARGAVWRCPHDPHLSITDGRSHVLAPAKAVAGKGLTLGVKDSADREMTDIQWQLPPEITLADYSMARKQTATTHLNDADHRSEEIHFYWTIPGQHRVRVEAVVAGATISAEIDVDVEGPTDVTMQPTTGAVVLGIVDHPMIGFVTMLTCGGDVPITPALCRTLVSRGMPRDLVDSKVPQWITEKAKSLSDQKVGPSSMRSKPIKRRRGCASIAASPRRRAAVGALRARS